MSELAMPTASTCGRRDRAPGDRRGLRPLARAIRRIGDADLRSAPAGARARRRVLGVGRRRSALPGPAGWHRHVDPRPRPSAAGLDRDRSARDARPRLQLLRHGAADRPGRTALGHPAGPGRLGGVLLQLRWRGQRGGVQDVPPHRPHPDRRGRRRLPRPHDGSAGAHPQGGLSRPVRPAAGRRRPRALRRRGRLASRSRRDRGCGVPRADPGRGRCLRGPGGLPRGRAGGHHGRWRAAWSWTRCRPGSAAPGPGSRTPGTESSRMS